MKASTSPDPWPDPSAALEKAIGEYEEKNRQLIHGKDGRLFTRKRKLSFGDCIFQMVGRRGKTQQAEADVVAGENGIGTLTASGLFNRRMAIDPSAVSEISKSLVRGLYLDPAVWKSLKKVRGKILVACDGSDIVLPSPKGNAEKYGTSCGGRAHSSENDPVMGKLSTLYDVMNGFTVETETGKYKKDEKKMLMDHIESLSSWLHRKFVFVCDRGYFSIEIADFMAQRHLFYVIRLNGKTLSDYWGGIEPGKDMVCGVRYSGPRLNNVKKSHPEIAYRVASTVYRIRFVRLRIQKADGTYAEEVLATNLPRSGFSVSDIAEIYRERWGHREQLQEDEVVAQDGTVLRIPGASLPPGHPRNGHRPQHDGPCREEGRNRQAAEERAHAVLQEGRGRNKAEALEDAERKRGTGDTAPPDLHVHRARKARKKLSTAQREEQVQNVLCRQLLTPSEDDAT